MFYEQFDRIQELIAKKCIKVILSNPFEGSVTQVKALVTRNLDDIAKQKQFMIITGGELGPEYACLTYDGFLAEMYKSDENKQQCARINEIYNKLNKPYKFLFLNGLNRWHRKYLIDRFKENSLLDQSIWTCLDRTMSDLHFLDKKYELPKYQNRLNDKSLDTLTFGQDVKDALFNNTWGDGIITSEPYIDTYFSLVTETVTQSHSFRTEKIWKPILAGHPWIAVANTGFYKDIRNLGFKTFDSVIDESFDLIENNQQRVERIADIVEDLCRSDLDQFLSECRYICTYNQQHAIEMSSRIQKEFPDRLIQFLNQNI